MEEHARHYTTNQDNIISRHISNTWTGSAWFFSGWIIKHLLFKLCEATVSSRFLYKWKKSPSFKSLPVFFPKISTDFSDYIFFALSHIIPQVKILDYVTIQKQGPLFTTSAHFVVIIYIHLSIKTVKGENDRMVVQRAAVTWCFCVRLAWVTQNEMETEEKRKIFDHCDVVETEIIFMVLFYGQVL